MFKFIAIIDKSHIIREGLAALLRNNNLCQRIGSLEHPDEWLPAFKDAEPDLVITNPGLWQKSDSKRWGHSSEKSIVGLIYQYCDREMLAQFDETIYITDSDETIVNKLRHLQKHNKPPATQSLSAREKDVLKLLLQGLSNKEVATKLVISVHTAIAHRKNIIEKTGIRSLPGLAVYAILNNISDMENIGGQ
ncbi:MAG: LuxR C-terminal-related transcriptional regulator [Bacteroidales bacterium]|jgi:DNA-binding NarL/FixJ family response regulator|nr:LuxR C-terminal-related transcriptional regulator [Bacteroidales bacterium]